ncbi:MAG: ATP-binding protein [Candidatus Cloacimonetes bacterium]|nr:ATP-binding protein [Candidatus Cloacimonadota bacterium]
MRNPFRYGRIVKGENFCNREKELTEIHKAIRNGHSFWIYSPRRYGKTSLILKAFEKINKDIKTIYFDMYNIQMLDDFARKYSQVLAKELFDWKINIKTLSRRIGSYFQNLYPKISFDSFGNPSFSLELRQIESQADIETILDVPEKIGERSGIKICIAFDEFQEVKRIEPFIINWMRSSFQKQINVSYVFLGSKQSLMESIFASPHSPFYEFGFKMPIYPISHTDLSNYIKRQFQKTKLKINNNTINKILEKSKCHPHFTQYFASVVWELILEGVSENQPDFTKNWMDRIIASQSLIFQNIFDQLNQNQRKVLTAIASLNENDKLFSIKYRKRFDLPDSSTMTTTIKSLIQKDLIYKYNNKYQINNPVFVEWIKSIYTS